MLRTVQFFANKFQNNILNPFIHLLAFKRREHTQVGPYSNTKLYL